MIQRMFEKGCAVEVPVSESFGEETRFGQGQVLFVFGASSALPFYADAVNKGGKFKWDIAMPPNNGKPAVNLYGASISIHKTTPEKELAAWLVCKFLGEKAQTTRWAIQTAYLPVRQSAQSDVTSAFKAQARWGAAADMYARLFDWIPYSMTESPAAGYDSVRGLIDRDILSKVIANPRADVKALLDAGVKRANEILKANAPQ
jgi:ABC-type glycerol-3-phosphate transport system substrate-binding protein